METCCIPGSPLAQVMDWCLMAPGHYLNHCWINNSKVLWHSWKGIIMRKSEDTNRQINIVTYILKSHPYLPGPMGLCSLHCTPLHSIHSIPHPRSCIIFILQPTLATIQDTIKYYEKCKSYVCSASFYQVFNFSILSRMKSAMNILDKIGRFMTTRFTMGIYSVKLSTLFCETLLTMIIC